MIQVPLSGAVGAGRFALVDPDDYTMVMRYNWYYRDGYALTKMNGRETRMHRFIMNETDPMIVIDHINRNRLDNTRGNLRRLDYLANANNRVDNVQIEVFGDSQTIAEWSRDPMCCVSYSVLRSRLYRGVPAWAAILSPKG